MNSLFRLEASTGSGGFGFDDTLSELLEDVARYFSEEILVKVEKWARSSKSGEQFIEDSLYIENISDDYLFR